MAHLRKSVDINASAQAVYDFITQPSKLPSFWPSMVDVSKITRQPNGAHEFDWIYKMAGLNFHGHAKTTEVQPPKVVRVRNDAGIPSTFVWTLQGADGAGTRLTLDVEYSIPAPVIGKLAEVIVVKMNEREIEMLLANLKDSVESTVGGETTAHVH